MPMTAKKSATTPIPVQLSEAEFNEFILPHLSMPRRGPRCKLGYHRLFNLILWVLYTGMQWECLPVPKDHEDTPEIHYTTVYKAFAGGPTTAHSSTPSSAVMALGIPATNIRRATKSPPLLTTTAMSWHRFPSHRLMKPIRSCYLKD